MPDPLLEVDGVSNYILRNVSLKLDRGRALGLIGQSGSGKSTLARIIARFERPESGAVRIEGRSVYGPGDVQLIFQEAAASLNPRFTAQEILEEPLVIQKRPRNGKAAAWLDLVGLPGSALRKRALEFSGGERQRLAIARALILEPKLLILDESFSGLDLLLQARLTELLRDLRARLGLTCILIAHDLNLAARVADEIAVMHAGEIVGPEHPNAQALFRASEALSLRGALV